MIDFNPHGFTEVSWSTAMANIEKAQYTLAHYDHWKPVYKMRLSRYRLHPKRYKFRMPSKFVPIRDNTGQHRT